jgi:hypothetical protein
MDLSQLSLLANAQSFPSVTIGINTHCTYPDNANEATQFKLHLRNVKEYILAHFSKKDITTLLKHFDDLAEELDFKHNLASIFVFLSNDTKVIIKLKQSIPQNISQIGRGFEIKPLVKAQLLGEQYLVLSLTQTIVRMYTAIDEHIEAELNNTDFPFVNHSLHYTNHTTHDSRKVDVMLSTYFNQVDKAVLKWVHHYQMKCVVMATAINYHHLLQVSDDATIYCGHHAMTQQTSSLVELGKLAWSVMLDKQAKKNRLAIESMQEAVGAGLVVTDIREIYLAVKVGNVAMLIIKDECQQFVKRTSDDAIELLSATEAFEEREDITNAIVWETFTKNGQLFFLPTNDLFPLGNIALKKKYV